MEISKIVITGGPCAGKTTAMKSLRGKDHSDELDQQCFQ